MEERGESMYPPEVVEVVKAMSFTGHPNIVGTASLRAVQYIGDYDSNDDASKATPRQFQEIIKRLMKMDNLYIADIKIGELERLRVIPPEMGVKGGRVVNYDRAAILAKLKELGDKRSHYFPAKMTPARYFEALEEFKEHIVRFTAAEVLAGSNGTVSLSAAMALPGRFKLDVVAYINNKYCDINMVYNRSDKDDVQLALKAAVLQYSKTKPFKMARRIFSIARADGDNATVDKLLPLFNSDLGRLYSIISDIAVLLYLFEHKQKIPTQRFKREIEDFRTRLTNIWNLSDFTRKLDQFIAMIEQLLVHESPEPLMKLEAALQEILNDATMKELRRIGLYPPPSRFLP
jgi:hypothetical protein